MATTKRRKRRPRWDRILAALLLLALAVGAAVGLPRLLAAPPQLDATQELAAGGQSSGLQLSPASASGRVLGFRDPGVTLRGLHGGEGDFVSNDRYAYLVQDLDADDAGSPQALARFDYTTRTLDWLCDTPGCDHRDPACPAYLPGRPLQLCLDGDSLYLHYTDYASGEVCLARCDLDGHDRRELLRIPGPAVGTFFAFSGEAIVAVNAWEGLVYAYDRSTGDLKQYLTLEDFIPAGSFEVVWDHYLVIVFSKEENVICYAAVDLATGQERVLCAYAQENDDRYLVTPVQDGGFLYYLRKKDGERCDFVRQSIATGEETVLNDDVFFPDGYTANRMDAGRIVDGCYVYSTTPVPNKQTDIDFTRYSFDLATGAPATPPVYNDHYQRVATFGEDYLVRTTTPDADGYATINARDFRLMAREDYEADNGNCLPIQDNTL